jgi:DNA-binding NtrC family response regulator
VTDTGARKVYYRLRGEVGGASRAYALRPGENWIGSMAGNTIVLPVRGVSRRHALLTLDPDGLTLEDMGSRNGTLVKGVRIQRTRLRAGDEVRMGPVRLRLEEVEPEDVSIAITVRTDAPISGLPKDDTTATPIEETGRVGLGLLEAVIARVCARPEPDLRGLVSLLSRELGASSMCIFELQKGEPVAIATSGVLPDLSRHRRFVELVRGAAASGHAVRATSLEGDVPLACAIGAGGGPDRFGVVVAGELRGRAREVEAVLRMLVVLCQRLRPEALATPTAPPSEDPGLAFPEGYVPGDSPAMRSFYAELRSLVHSDLPVLLMGETGVGKELLARMLHDSSPRRDGPYVAINCAAIPADLLESEMFGIGKGIATGVSERRGKFQMAEGGTLLLDEIGDMPLELQAKLLRALQEKEVQPVGGAPVSVDIRVVAATNSDLQRRMEEGRFRRDLYFRIAGFTLHVPPLRERRDDVPVLVESFMRVHARETGKGVRGITVKALRALTDYAWPGNVRELEHEVRRLVHLCPEGQAIDSTMISPHVVADPREGAAPAALETLELAKNVSAVERRVIREALDKAGGNRTQAAKLLGISRNGLAIKMEKLSLRND